MPTARNEAELKAMLSPALIEAVRYVAQQIYDENITVVNDVVYSWPGGRRTHDLLTAWDTKASGGGGHATGEFKFAPNKMHYHKSAVPGGGGVKEQLIDIVYQGVAGNFGYPPMGPAHASEDPRFWNQYWANARNAWAELCHVIGKRKIRQYIEEGFAHAGLRYRSRGGAIGMEVYDNK